MARAGRFSQAVDQFRDWRWRIANLYYITDKAGRRVKFEPNWAQLQLMDEMHCMNLVLKCRQLGFTTFIQLFMLDEVIFNSNVRAGTIAHNLRDAASIFNDKVKYPYTQLPEGIRQARHQIRDSASELALCNNSSIRVGTSLRSGTLNFLHISEYGKLCAKYPEKAREVRTGALNTVQAGQWITIESTAEGQEGDFYAQCQESQSLARVGGRLTTLDFKFFFFPWWKEPGYRLSDEDADGVVITAEFQKYFDELKTQHGIVLDAGQQAWYVKKAASQLGDMKREYPSTADEAFSASVEGSYYGAWIEAAETQGRIGTFAAEPGIPVHTAWDIGVGDSTAIWFWQRLHKEVRVVGYFEASGEGVPFYAETIKKLYKDNGWTREKAIDFVPHDARVKEWGSGKTRLEELIDAGFRPKIATEMSIDDGINAVRATIPMCTFDAAKCADGIKAMKAYRKEWNDEAGCWSSRPVDKHWSKHGADAFRYLSAAHRDITPEKAEPEKPKSGLSPAMFRDEMLRRDAQSGIAIR